MSPIKKLWDRLTGKEANGNAVNVINLESDPIYTVITSNQSSTQKVDLPTGIPISVVSSWEQYSPSANPVTTPNQQPKTLQGAKLKIGDRILHGERPGVIDDIPNDRIAWIQFDGSPPDCKTGINLEELSMAEENGPLASRFNSGKVQFSLIPVSAQTAEAKVWMKGAVKYGRNNWQKGLSFLSILDSLLRHAIAYQNGETFDQETHEHHMAHVRCNAAMLIEFEETHKELDDRK